MKQQTPYSAADFERDYCARSGIQVETNRKFQRVVPCDCDYDKCRGWQMISIALERDFAADGIPYPV
jgi:hypothetical protein